jgi:hypothetical protein
MNVEVKKCVAKHLTCESDTCVGDQIKSMKGIPDKANFRTA